MYTPPLIKIDQNPLGFTTPSEKYLDEIHPGVVRDFMTLFSKFPVAAVEHLMNNTDRLTCGQYSTADGYGCVLNILSRKLPRVFLGKADVMEYFDQLTLDAGTDLEIADPMRLPKLIMDVWDGASTGDVAVRYPGVYINYPMLGPRHIYAMAKKYLDDLAAKTAAEQTRQDMVMTAVATASA